MLQKMDFLKPTTMRVLELFLARPAGEWHEREVMRSTGVSKGSANRVLRELASLAILDRRERGRMVFYRLKADEPFVKQLKIAGTVWSLRRFVEGLKPTARKVILFGSGAEGTDVAESDLDLLILTADKKTARDRVSAFNRRAAKRISPMIINGEEFASLRRADPPLFERIDRGVVLWETA